MSYINGAPSKTRNAYVVYTRHVFKVRIGLKLPPIGCTVREHAFAGSYMCSLTNVCHFVAGRSFFYVKKDWTTMCAAIHNHASCEFHAVIRVLLARNNNAVEIRRQHFEVYGSNVKSESKVRKWRQSSSPKAKKFKQASSVRKIMATVFWDGKGILLIDFL